MKLSKKDIQNIYREIQENPCTNVVTITSEDGTVITVSLSDLNRIK